MHNNNKFFYISVLTVLSSLAVVFLHCNGVFWSHPSGNLWLTANIIESMFYFAVPVFFMISGCTLIDYKTRYSTKVFFLKRVNKTVIPFLIWSTFSLVFGWVQDTNIKISPIWIVSSIINYHYMYIYWFFIPLFAIYLSIPVLADIQNKVRTFTYMIVFGLITISLFGFMLSCNFAESIIPHNFTSPVCGGFLIYPLLGYVLHHTKQSKTTRLLMYLAGIISTMAHFWFTYSCSYNQILNVFKNYTHITSVMQACAVFVFVKYNAHFLNRQEKIRQAILYIQPAALGIYLSHQYIIYLMNEIGVNEGSLLYRTVGAVGIYMILAVVIRQLQRMHWLRILFP